MPSKKVSGLRSMQGGAVLHLWFFLLSGSGVTLIFHLGLSKQSHLILEETCVSDHAKHAAAAAKIQGGSSLRGGRGEKNKQKDIQPNILELN